MYPDCSGEKRLTQVASNAAGKLRSLGDNGGAHQRFSNQIQENFNKEVGKDRKTNVLCACLGAKEC